MATRHLMYDLPKRNLLAKGAARRHLFACDSWLIRAHADRLSVPAREVMVAASVLGQEIERAALGVVSELGAELDDALAEVVSAGLLTEVLKRGLAAEG